MMKKIAVVDTLNCVACGECFKRCPRNAIEIKNGITAYVDTRMCVGCGICEKYCPALAIKVGEYNV